MSNLAWGGTQTICEGCDRRPIHLRGKSTINIQRARMRFPKLFKL